MSESPIPTIDDLLLHDGFVRSVARACVRGDDLVEDTVQQTWLEVLQRGPRHGKAPKAWLARVTRNAGFGLLRKRARQAKHETAAVKQQGVGNVPTATEIASRETVRRCLLDAVLSLKEPYQSAVVLRYYEALPPRAVAARLGVPVETARTRIKRGLKQLRKILDAEHGGDRRTWIGALVPLAGLGAEATAAGGLGAGALALGAVAILLGAGGLWGTLRGADAPAPGAAPPVPTEDPTLIGRAKTTVRGRGRGVILARIEGARPGGSLWVAAHRTGPFYGGGNMPSDRAQLFASRLSAPLGGSRVVARAPVTADGRCRLEGVPAGMYSLRLLAEGRMHGVWPAMMLADGAHMPARLTVPDGHLEFEGRARYADGSAFHGWVYAQAPVGPGVASFSFTAPSGHPPVHADAEGRFKLTGLEEGPVLLCALAEGELFVQRSVSLPVASPYDFIVLDRSTLKPLRVLDAEGRPVAGAHVVAAAGGGGMEGVEHLLSMRTDETGRVLVPAQGDVFVSAPGFLPQEVKGRKRREVEAVTLRRGARIEGHLTGPDGGGLADVRVFALRSDYGGEPVSAMSSKDGSYTIPLLTAGEYTVYAHGNGWTTGGIVAGVGRDFNPLAVDVPEPPATRKHDLRLVSAGRITGQVLDHTGAPVEGALVMLGYTDRGRTKRAPARNTRRQLMAWLATDAEGRFVADTVLTDADVACSVSTAAGARATSPFLSVPSGGHRDVTIQLPQPYSFTAVVTDAETGEAIPEVSISTKGQGGRSWHGWGYTDRHGRIVARPSGLRPGTQVTVKLESPTHQDKKSTITLPETSGSLALTLEAGLSISGRVRALEATDARHVRLELKDAQGQYVRFAHRRPRLDTEGRLVLRGLAPGTYKLRAWAGERTARIEVAAGTENVELHLRKHEAVPAPTQDATLVVNVRTAGAAAPTSFRAAAYGKYYAHMKPSAVSGGGRRGKNGRVAFAAIPPGSRFWIAVWDVTPPAGEAPAGAVVAGPFLATADEQVIDVHVPPGKVIEGRLLAPEGTGMRGAMIEAAPIHEGFEILSLEVHAKVRTGRDGSFRLAGLGEMDYQLRARLPEGVVMSEQVRARGGDQAVRVVTHRGRPTPSGPELTVLDGAGKPVPQARVQFSSGQVGYVSGSADEHGRILFQSQDAKPPFDIRVIPPSDRPDLGCYAASVWQPAPTTFRLPAAAQIRGTIVGTRPPHEASYARGYAQVMFRPAGGTWSRPYYSSNGMGSGAMFAHATVDERGQFVIGHLPPGDYEIGAWLPFCGMCRMEEVKVIRARTGETDVEVALFAGRPLRVRIENWQPAGKGVRVRLPHIERFRKGRWLGAQMASIDARGRCVFYDVRPGERYRIRAVRPDLGMYAGNNDVRWSEDELVLRLVPGGIVRGRLMLPTSALPTQTSVYLHGGGLNLDGTLQKDLTFEIRGVPPGTFTLHGQAHTPGAYYSAQVEVSAGDGVTVRLEETRLPGR